MLSVSHCYFAKVNIWYFCSEVKYLRNFQIRGMNYYFVKTVINNLCRPVKVFDNEELNINAFVERGKFVQTQTTVICSFNICVWNPYSQASEAHELEAKEIKTLDFVIKDADNMPIDDFAMIAQWSGDSSFKVIIDLKVSRCKLNIVTEVSKHILSFLNFFLVNL